MPHGDIAALWGAITCPTLLLYGANSWASNPERDGRLEHFSTAKVIEFENAGHWLHHDQFDRFMSTLDEFLYTGRRLRAPARDKRRRNGLYGADFRTAEGDRKSVG